MEDRADIWLSALDMIIYQYDGRSALVLTVFFIHGHGIDIIASS